MVPILGKNLCLDLMTYFVLAHPVLEGAAVILKLLLNHQSTYTQVQNVWSGSMAIRFVEFSNFPTLLGPCSMLKKLSKKFLSLDIRDNPIYPI